MKLKRIKDAQAYQKILEEQINDKKARKLKVKTSSLKRMEKASAASTAEQKFKMTPVEEKSLPAVVSSRYSNSNTACTRDLFTPSEGNCLSHHLSNYTTPKPRMVVESDCVNLKRRNSSKHL